VRGAQAGKPPADLSIPKNYRWVPPAVPAGLPFNVAQLYMRMAERIREGKSLSPDFDVAVKRHPSLDAIQKASVTGIRQKTRKTGNDTLGGELQNAVLPSFLAPPNKTRYLPGNQSGPTRKQKLDSTPIDVRVRRHRQRLGSNAPIESAPASMLSPLLLRLPGHSRLSHSVCRY
jgi:hypothetical protein